jgi:hypothetical protein
MVFEPQILLFEQAKTFRALILMTTVMGKSIFPFQNSVSTSRLVETVTPCVVPIQWVPRTLSSRLKLLGHKAEHSSPSIAEVKNGGAIPPRPIRVNGLVLKSARAQLHLT